MERERTTMLTTLRIKNLALVADLTLELAPGLNIITGETGAGKSILIGALNLVLGERADRTLIRGGSDSCTVEAVFSVGKMQAALNAFLEENGLERCEEPELLVKRTFTAAGTNRQFVNGSPTTLATLAAIGEWLVDIHGPHDHQSLLHPARQLEILDAFGNLHAERKAFAELTRRHAAVVAEKAALVVDEQTYAQQLDLLRFQAHEIEAAQLQPGEEEQLEQDYQRASNAAKLLELGQRALGLISDDEESLVSQAGALGRTLQELTRVDAGASALAELHAQVLSTCQELQTEISHYVDRLELDPARLLQLEERMNLLHTLKKKYGPSVEAVIAFGETARRKLQNLEQRDSELARLNAELEKIEAELLKEGRALGAKRRRLIPQLNKAVVKQLRDLGFQQSQFEVQLTSQEKLPTPLPTTGLDVVEFQFAPNPGEPARPLRAIASSGELAR
ncbi:MAG TPA: AAA family ATPase, partial [Bacillota bacterium]|nr:AAA family ATPase [Bacillota bacterium]